MSARATIVHADALTVNMQEATVIYVYLVPEGLRKVLPKLLDARARGCRVLSNIFAVPGWEPTRIVEYRGGLKLYVYS